MVKERTIGESWTGDKYIHGPRKTDPKKYDQFRLGPKTKSGKRLVFGRIKGTNNWERQSTLRPRKSKKKVVIRRRDGVKQRYWKSYGFKVTQTPKVRKTDMDMLVRDYQQGKINIGEFIEQRAQLQEQSKIKRKQRPRNKTMLLAKQLEKDLKPVARKITVAGSIRRKVNNPGDIDIVLIPKDKDKIKEKVRKLGKIEAQGDKMVQARINGVDTDIYFATNQDYGAQLMTRTGPFGANIYNRTLAREKGYLLNQYGLFDRKSGKRIAVSEKDIYKKLGKKYRVPEDRGKPRK